MESSLSSKMTKSKSMKEPPNGWLGNHKRAETNLSVVFACAMIVPQRQFLRIVSENVTNLIERYRLRTSKNKKKYFDLEGQSLSIPQICDFYIFHKVSRNSSNPVQSFPPWSRRKAYGHHSLGSVSCTFPRAATVFCWKGTISWDEDSRCVACPFW